MLIAQCTIDQSVVVTAIKEGRQQYATVYTHADFAKGKTVEDIIKEYGYKMRLDIDKWTLGNYFTIPHAITHETKRSCTIIFFAKTITKDQWFTSCLEYFIENL